MSLEYARFQGTTPTSTGNVSFTTSFTPAFILVRACWATSSSLVAGCSFSFGMTTSYSEQVAYVTMSQDAASSPYMISSQYVGQVLVLASPTADSVAVEASLTSAGLTSTGFALDFTTVSSTTGYEYVIEAFGGDVSGAEILALESPSSTGNHTYSSLTKGTPAAAIFGSIGATTTSSGGASAATGVMVGWGVSSSAQGVSMTTGSASEADGQQLTNACVCTGGGNVIAALSSFGNNSCTLDYTATFSGVYVFTLFLYGTFQAATFSNNSPTSNGDQSNSLSFSPAFVMTACQGQAASSSLQDAYSLAIGTYDGTNSDCFVAVWDNPSKLNADSVAKSVYDSTNAILGYNSSATKTLAASGASLSSGAEFDFTTTQSTAYQYIGFALASGETPPSAPTGLSVTNDATNPTTVLDLSWTASSGATSYDVLQASTLSGTFSQVASGISGTSTTITSLSAGTEYAFEVEAVGSGGTSSPSSAVAWATEVTPAANLSVVTATSIQITPSYAAPFGSTIAIANFLLRYETPVGAGNWSSPTSFSASPCTLSGLSPGTQYGIELAAVIESNNGDWSGTIQGPWSSELTVTTSNNPVGEPAGVWGGCAAASGPPGPTVRTIQKSVTQNSTW
jgi:hypothetical protein